MTWWGALFDSFSLHFTDSYDNMTLRHKLNNCSKRGIVFLLFGKNAFSTLSFPFLVCNGLCRSKRSYAFFGAQLRLRTFYFIAMWECLMWQNSLDFY